MREVNAPQAVKQELLRVRQEITANKLSYVVGVTSVAGRPIEKITGEKQLSIAEEKKIFDDIRQRIVLLERAVKALPYRELVTIPSGFVYGTPSQKNLTFGKEASSVLSRIRVDTEPAGPLGHWPVMKAIINMSTMSWSMLRNSM